MIQLIDTLATNLFVFARSSMLNSKLIQFIVKCDKSFYHPYRKNIVKKMSEAFIRKQNFILLRFCSRLKEKKLFFLSQRMRSVNASINVLPKFCSYAGLKFTFPVVLKMLTACSVIKILNLKRPFVNITQRT